MKKYLIIFAVFIISFLISNYSIKNVFLGNSPKVNPYYLTNLKYDLNTTTSNIARIFTPNKTRVNSSETASIPAELFKPLIKGVSAYERNDDEVILDVKSGTKYKIRQIKLSDGTVLNAIDLTGN